MDREANRKLTQIHADVPRETYKKLFKKEDVYEKERYVIEETLRKGNNIPKEKREALEKVLESGSLNRERLVVDEKVASELEKRVEARVRQAIDSGELPKYDPSKDHQAQRWLKKQGRK